MAEAADKARWNRTFAILAQLYNQSCGKDDDPIQLTQFYPWEQAKKKRPPPPTAADHQMLTGLFPGSNPK